MITYHSTPQPAKRAGSYIPLVAFSMLVIMAAVALALDNLWVESASVELVTAAESAALGTGRSLIDDDLLRNNVDHTLRNQLARELAQDIAAKNGVAGQPVSLNPAEGEDIWLGKLVTNEETGQTLFLQTETFPTSVVVNARRTKSGSNPIALFFQGLTGKDSADVTVRVEATADNHVRGFRPYGNVKTPALPLGILKSDPLGIRQDTWATQIEAGLGTDLYSYNQETNEVEAGSDGIPEMTLLTFAAGGSLNGVNVHLADVTGTRDLDGLIEQIKTGWSAADLAAGNGEFSLHDTPLLLSSVSIFTDQLQTELEKVIGEPRICTLYSSFNVLPVSGLGQVTTTDFVAIRVMDVIPIASNVCQIIVQPTVITTRTAMLASENEDDEADPVAPNRYIYKLQLTQ